MRRCERILGWGCGALYESSRRTLDPLSINEKAGVDVDLASEKDVVELGGVDGWHERSKKRRKEEMTERREGAGEWIYIRSRGSGGGLE